MNKLTGTQELLVLIRHAMIAQNCSVTSLAKKMGVTRNALAQSLSRENISVNQVLRILDAMDCVLNVTITHKDQIVPPDKLPPSCPYAAGGILHSQ